MLLSLDRRRATQRTGAHLVEFAVVFPVFIVFVFGLIEIGRAMMVTSLLTDTARLGCRVGILSGKSNSDITAAVDAQLARYRISGHTTTIEVNGTNVDASTADSRDRISVSVSVNASNVSWLPTAWFVNGTLHSRFALARE